jgi:hypothetical protein
MPCQHRNLDSNGRLHSTSQCMGSQSMFHTCCICASAWLSVHCSVAVSGSQDGTAPPGVQCGLLFSRHCEGRVQLCLHYTAVCCNCGVVPLVLLCRWWIPQLWIGLKPAQLQGPSGPWYSDGTSDTSDTTTIPGKLHLSRAGPSRSAPLL